MELGDGYVGFVTPFYLPECRFKTLHKKKVNKTNLQREKSKE